MNFCFYFTISTAGCTRRAPEARIAARFGAADSLCPQGSDKGLTAVQSPETWSEFVKLASP